MMGWLPVPFLCSETHELGEELVASYLLSSSLEPKTFIYILRCCRFLEESAGAINQTDYELGTATNYLVRFVFVGVELSRVGRQALDLGSSIPVMDEAGMVSGR